MRYQVVQKIYFANGSLAFANGIATFDSREKALKRARLEQRRIPSNERGFSRIVIREVKVENEEAD